MTPAVDREQQGAFAAAAAALLRQARRSKKMTQTDVANRTGGVISKAALANYETGHRSLRIEVFWAIARALDEDPGALMLAAERAVGYGISPADAPITVDVEAVIGSEDERLTPVRRWFAMRLRAGGARLAVSTIVLDQVALGALAQLMGTDVAGCRSILADVSAAPTIELGSGMSRTA